MKRRGTIWGSLLLILLLVTVATTGLANSTRRSRSHRSLKSRAHGKASKADQDKNAQDELAKDQVRLRLADGTAFEVQEARETPQGIWYKRAGVTYLVPRERVKAIERGSDPKPTKPKKEKEDRFERVAIVTPAEPPPAVVADGTSRIWIHLKGGARVEADRAEESTAGVWYHRGPLSIFVERDRIDHLEREDLENLGESESSIKKQGWTTGNARLDSLIKQNGSKYGVDPYFIFCVMEQESHFNARVVSPKGARGLMQLMPGTAARFGVRHPFNPAENISGGTRYLKELINQFDRRVDLVLASYNAGEHAVTRFGGRVPPYDETRNYVKRISYRYRRAKPATARTGSRTGSSAGGEN